MNYTLQAGTREGANEVYFEGIPSAATRESLKALKMRWNSAKKCWWGFVAEEAIRDAIDGVPQDVANIKTQAEALKDYYTIDTTATDGYMGASAFRGSQPQHLYGAELAKAIREAFKKCGVRGVTVRSKTFSGGQEIGITVKINPGDIHTKEDFIENYNFYGKTWIRMPNGKDMYQEEFFALPQEEFEQLKKDCASCYYDWFLEDLNGYGYQINNYYYAKDEHFTEQFAKRFEIIHRIVNAFNNDSSNSMVDYFSRGFYDFYTIKA